MTSLSGGGCVYPVHVYTGAALPSIGKGSNERKRYAQCGSQTHVCCGTQQGEQHKACNYSVITMSIIVRQPNLHAVNESL